jgi:hypothetical protein
MAATAPKSKKGCGLAAASAISAAHEARAAGATRADVLPDVPTVGEFVPGYEAIGWVGVGAISASALSLLYPQSGIPGYSRQDYLDALLAEQESEIRRCLQKGAHVVQIDFTEGRLSIKLDPTRRLLASFIDLNNLLMSGFLPRRVSRVAACNISVL